MASNLAARVFLISKVTKAVAMGDLSKLFDVDERGEMLDLKMPLSPISALTRMASYHAGFLTSCSPRSWLTMSTNLTAVNVTNQVWSIAAVSKAVVNSEGGERRRDVERLGGADNINVMAANLTLQFRTIAVAMDYLQTVIVLGDLTQKIAVFVAEVKKGKLSVQLQAEVGTYGAFSKELHFA
ncbi:hypothetical protein AX14_008820 [Amanita brunnescens Koide BX004]|nr:hypothetical protein AX14_008820 [Amanita brunnescens Koide BX004]